MKRDVSNEIELRNRKENPFGWSQAEIYHNGSMIGWIECGAFDFSDKRYSHTEVKEPPNTTRVTIWLDAE